ncbi:MAG: class II fructose-bisphosphate aldolase family protein [Candidatus Aenigmarchaeota archaeon]|nr:class II fructose-bisphosphate aldolase family protein [Candidatus Aenigmarchaeota archaeon]
MLVNGNILKKAKGKYAVGAFDINNLEMLKAVISACVEERSPVIIQTTEGAIRYAGIEYLASMAKIAALQGIPVVLHLDHGQQLDTVKACIAHGYTSIMFDGSHLPFDKNVATMKKVVSLAKGRTVEGELGVILGKEDNIKSAKNFYTDPNAAELFVKKTGIDSLAVAIGTKHGLSKKDISEGMKKHGFRLRFDILKEISERVDVPLVLHGGSDVAPADIKKCIRLGVAKINIDTDLRVAFTKSVREFIKKNPEVYDPREMLKPAMESVKKVVKKKVREFGSYNKA